MIQEEHLREIVGHLLQSRPEDLGPGSPLNGNLSGSIGRARLDAALRNKLGSSRSEIYTVTTYGQLAAVLCNDESNTSLSGEKRSQIPEVNTNYQATTTGHHHDVGIDIEAICNLPEAADYWTASFYQTHFTNTEIGYCMLQPKPLETFAGLWCAKEALKKTSHKWARLDWQEIEVSHDRDDSPYLIVHGADLRPEYSVSISHTLEFSVAVVVRVSRVDFQKENSVTVPTKTAPLERGSQFKSVRPVFLLLLAALLVSIWYIVQTHR